MRGFMAKLRRDVRALSPIFAVLLLIAIAVIAGIIIYMYTSGYLSTMMGGGTAGQEKVAIQAVEVSGSTVTVWAKSTGGGDVAITEAILKNAAGQTLEVLPLGTAVTLLADGTIDDIVCAFTTTLDPGSTYTVTLISRAGNQFVSPAFKA